MSYKRPLKLYIAHKLANRKKIKIFTEEIEKEYYVECLNPFYSIKRDEIDILDSLKTKEEREQFKRTWTSDACKTIVETDLGLIDKCDGIIAFVEEGVLGTAMEIQYARLTNKRIFIITNDYTYHPWIRYYADGLFKNVDEFKKWLKDKGYERRK